MTEYNQELTKALQLAEAAGLLILEKRATALQNVTEKENNEGPVTEADLAADRLIRTGLENAFPQDTLVTEETWTAKTPLPHAERLWIVDPLDGTSDFSRGGDDYAVMIGLCVEGQPRVGVVYQPKTATFWYGIDAGSVSQAWKRHGMHKKALHVRAFDASQASALVSRSHPSKVIDQMLTTMGLHDRITRGSVGLKAGAIAHGEADIYLTATNKIKVWDTCAPQAILNAAGGTLTDLLGTPLRYDSLAAHPHGILAASRNAKDHFLPLIKELRSETLE